MNIKLPNLEKTAVYLAYLFYISTNSFWAYRLFHENNLFAAAASLAPIAVLLAHYINVKWRIPVNVLIVSASIYAVIVIRSGFYPKMILFYGMCFMLLLDSQMAETPGQLKHFYYFSFLFMLGSFINLYFPGIYRRVILPAFSGSSQYNRLLEWFNRRSYLIIPGFTNQTSFNACHFVYGLGYILCKRFSYREKMRLEWVAVALLVVCLVLTNKRAHFLFMILALAIAYYYSGETDKKGKRFAILVMVGVLSLALLLVLLPRINVGVFIKLNRTLEALESESDADVMSGRGELYAIAVKLFLRNPILGIGWEKFRLHPDVPGGVETHNIYLQLLCETGVIGFGIFLFFFIFALYITVKNCRDARTAEEHHTAGFCLFMQIFFLLYGITGNPLYDPPYYVPYFLICSFSFSQRRYILGAEYAS